VHLTRLVIHKYRNVTPGTTLVFSPGKNVLLGKNATGKTTLLNLLASVVSSDFSGLKGEEFSLEYELVAPEGRIQAVVRNEWKSPTPFSIEGLSLLQEATSSYQFTWSIRAAWASGVIKIETTPSTVQVVKDESGDTRSGTTGDLSGMGWSLPRGCFLALMRTFPDEPGLHVSFAKFFVSSFSNERLRFDESLDFFRGMLSREVGVSGRGPDAGTGAGVPPEVRKLVAREVAADVEQGVLEFSDKQLRFLGASLGDMGFGSGRMRVERIEKRLEEGVEHFRFGRFGFEFVREDGSAIHHSLLSYGQKRLLSFYYYLDCSSRVVIADELVNGLHHDWIDSCLDAIGDRQAFLTSQNPLLLDYLHFESAEQARSSFILCRMEKHEKQERLVWENMTEEDSERFFSAYQVGIQHVSEILRTKGLW
jgi:energy-coupling factor transporter ATP-binding protein EcfA2